MSGRICGGICPRTATRRSVDGVWVVFWSRAQLCVTIFAGCVSDLDAGDPLYLLSLQGVDVQVDGVVVSFRRRGHRQVVHQVVGSTYWCENLGWACLMAEMALQKLEVYVLFTPVFIHFYSKWAGKLRSYFACEVVRGVREVMGAIVHPFSN